MRKYGVVFDFNGTMFWDTNYQNSSWDEYLTKYGIILSPSEKVEYFHGRNGKDTFEYIFKRKIASDELEFLIEEKEVLYRLECEKNKMELAPGLIPLLNYLNENDIKIAIATASGKNNVNFFIKKFDLLKYFNKENIIFNDGKIKGKPFPDLFNKAISSINVKNSDVIIFEDSKSGIEAAMRANVKDIIIVDSSGDNYEKYNFTKITHFDQFDRSVFKK